MTSGGGEGLVSGRLSHSPPASPVPTQSQPAPIPASLALGEAEVVLKVRSLQSPALPCPISSAVRVRPLDQTRPSLPVQAPFSPFSLPPAPFHLPPSGPAPPILARLSPTRFPGRKLGHGSASEGDRLALYLHFHALLRLPGHILHRQPLSTPPPPPSLTSPLSPHSPHSPHSTAPSMPPKAPRFAQTRLGPPE